MKEEQIIINKHYYKPNQSIIMKEIESQLKGLKLIGMSKEYHQLLASKQLHNLGFSEGLDMLLQAELEERKTKRFERLKKKAKFRYQASLEELIIERARGLNKEILHALGSCDYLEKGESIIITGATGSGKSFLASALGHQACVIGKTVAYFNMTKLSTKLKMVRAEGTNLVFFERLSKTALLIIDDFGLAPLTKEQKYDLLEIIEDRHNKTSTLIASQLPVKTWHEVIGDVTIADAILDRLVHTAHRIELKGESLRKRK